MEILVAHDWPGNVRQLKNAIERAVVACRQPTIGPECLDLGEPAVETSPEANTLESVEKRHIMTVLEDTEWNITQAAKRLAIDRVTLYNKIKKYGLSKPGE